MDRTPVGPGTLLAGRFVLEDLLDETEGARFWRATDKILARSVAVHVIAADDPRSEALLNAVVHKDYSSGIPIQISVYDDRIVLWNPGDLPENWTLEKLVGKHPSCPFNPLLANAFFRAGYIESWGRGIEKIHRECREHGIKPPVYDFGMAGLMLTFRANPEHLQAAVGAAVAPPAGRFALPVGQYGVGRTQLLDEDLSDPETGFQLRLAFKLMDLQEALGASAPARAASDGC